MRSVTFWKVSAAVALLTTSLLAGPQAAQACSLSPISEFETDDSLDPAEVKDPQEVSLDLLFIKRGQDGESSACDDLGSIRVRVEPREPDTGYIFEIVGDDGPNFFQLDENQAIRVSDSGSKYFHWGDGLSDEQERIDFEMVVTPVNRAGEMGPTSEPLRIADPGRSGGVCSISGLRSPAAASGALALLFLAAIGWRRRD